MNEQNDYSYIKRNLESIRARADAAAAASPYGQPYELLLATTKQEVFADIAAWLDKQLAKQ